jgi:hypothetical protein
MRRQGPGAPALVPIFVKQFRPQFMDKNFEFQIEN